MGWTQKLGPIGVALYIWIQCVSAAFALEGDNGTTPVPGVGVSNTVGNSGVGSQIPATIATGAFATMGGQLNQCFGNLGMFDANLVGNVRNIVDISSGENPTNPMPGMNGTSPCPEERIPDPESMSCAMFQSDGKNAIYSPKKLKAKEKEINAAIGAIQCKQNRLQSLMNEVSCLETQSGALKAQIQSMENIFDKNFQNWQKDMLTIDTALQDRKDQDQFVIARLNGSKDSGRKGLLQMKDEISAAIGELMGGGGGDKSDGGQGGGTGVLLNMQEQARAIAKARTDFTYHKSARAVSLMNQCFSKNQSAGYRCYQGGPVVTPKQYILCRYEQNLKLGSAKEVNFDKATAKLAASKRSALEALLNSVDQYSDKFTPSAPTGDQKQDASNAVENANAVATIRSFDDLKAQLESNLAQFQDSGLDIKGEVLRQYQSCYNWGNSVATSEVQKKTGVLGQELQQIDILDRKANSQAQAAIDKYTKSFDSAIMALTGQHSSLDPAACNAAGIDRKVGCLQELSTKLNDIYRGRPDGQGTLMNMNVSSQDPKLAFKISCNGILGCVNTLQNAEDGLKREVTRITNFKKNYALQAKSNLENFVSTMAKSLSPQAQMIRSKLDQLRSAARSMGVEIGKVDEMKGEKLDTAGGSDGNLPKKPDDILAVIAGKMNPRFPDIEGDAFSGAKEKLTAKQPELSEKMDKANAALQALQGLDQQCKDETATKVNDVLKKVVSSCTKSETDCESYVKMTDDSPDASLTAAVGRITNSIGLLDGSASIKSSLSRGVASCKSLQKKLDEARSAKKALAGSESKNMGDTSEYKDANDFLKKYSDSGDGEKSDSSCDELSDSFVKFANGVGGSSSSSDSGGKSSAGSGK